VLPGCVRW